MPSTSDVSAPFDAIAGEYDAAFSHSPTGRLQRDVVHVFLKKLIENQKVTTVLELNCGTGEDAIWLAKQGCRVLATDVSEKMIEVVQTKIEREKLSPPPDFSRDERREKLSPPPGFSRDERREKLSLTPDFSRGGDEAFSREEQAAGSIETTVCSIENLPDFFEKNGHRRFDLVFSNFGGLNCLPPENLRAFGAFLPQILRPDGHFVAVVMGRFCWWETLYFLLKMDVKNAFRRRSKIPVMASLDSETRVATWYFSPDEFLEIGNWKLENRNWKLENRNWKFGNRNWKLENRNWKLENRNFQERQQGQMIDFQPDAVEGASAANPINFQFLFSNFQFPISNFQSPISNFQFPISNFQSPISNFQFPISNFQIQPVGFWLPPSYLDPFFKKFPRLLRVLNFLEKKCRGRFCAFGADHFLIAIRNSTAHNNH